MSVVLLHTSCYPGTNGIDVFYKDGRLYAEARRGDRKWGVRSPEDYLVEGLWNKIIVAWSPVKGLVLAIDERFYLVDQDVGGQQMTNQVLALFLTLVCTYVGKLLVSARVH